jgi:hypothetical protein
MGKKVIFLLLTLFSCSLYDFNQIYNIEFPNLQPVYNTSFPEIEYRILGSFYMDIQVEFYNSYFQWEVDPDLTKRLYTTNGTLKWDKPLISTMVYRLTVRPFSVRGGREIKINTVIKEVFFWVF